MHRNKLYQLMKYIDDVSGEELPYYCAYGTLIGTIREKGIIPWDKDCDIWVPITYYDEFIKKLEKNNTGNFDIHSESDFNYNQLFSRISMKGENHLETSIDIFPLVGITSDFSEQKKFIRKSKFIFKFYYAKNVQLKEYKNRKKRGLQILLAKTLVFLIPNQWFIEQYKNMLNRYSYENSDYVYNICGSYGEREILKKDWFANVMRTDFDDFQVNSPGGYDELLKHIYGNYMISKKENYLS